MEKNPYAGLSNMLAGTPAKKTPMPPSSPDESTDEGTEETSFMSSLRDAAQGIVDMIDEHMNSGEEQSESPESSGQDSEYE